MGKRTASLLVATTLFLGCGTEHKPPASSAMTVPELLAKADQYARARDYARATAALEQVLKIEPKQRDALLMIAQATQNHAMLVSQRGDRQAAHDWYVKSAGYMKELRAAYPQFNAREASVMPGVLFHEARAEALAGHSDKALAARVAAINSGFDDAEEINKEADLKSLRDLPAYKKILHDASSRVSHSARERAKQLLAAQQPFDFDFALLTADGKPVSKKDFAGKVLIVDVWGTWCRPCRAELPHLEELLKKHRQAGLAVVGINYEQAPNPASLILDFIKENHVTYPCLIGDEKTFAQIPDFRALPTTLFIDRSGTVRLKVQGFDPARTDMAGIASFLLDEKVPPTLQ
jgi:thiol-disulfide isomerase/thioredoxin